MYKMYNYIILTLEQREVYPKIIETVHYQIIKFVKNNHCTYCANIKAHQLAVTLTQRYKSEVFNGHKL